LALPAVIEKKPAPAQQPPAPAALIFSGKKPVQPAKVETTEANKTEPPPLSPKP